MNTIKDKCSACGGKGWIFRGNGLDHTCEVCFDQQPEEDAQDAVGIAVEALRKISTWHFGWDGDCGVTAVADEALEAVDRLQRGKV